MKIVYAIAIAFKMSRFCQHQLKVTMVKVVQSLYLACNIDNYITAKTK